MDILEELGQFSLDGATHADVHGLLERAAKEIRVLRLLAGAVTRGPSFSDIREQAHAKPILKAFDGA